MLGIKDQGHLHGANPLLARWLAVQQGRKCPASVSSPVTSIFVRCGCSGTSRGASSRWSRAAHRRTRWLPQGCGRLLRKVQPRAETPVRRRPWGGWRREAAPAPRTRWRASRGGESASACRPRARWRWAACREAEGTHFFKVAMSGQVCDVVASVVQIVTGLATVHRAVLPAGVPERATDFFGLKTAGWSVVAMISPRLTLFGSREELVELLLVGLVPEESYSSARVCIRRAHVLRTFAPDGMVHLSAAAFMAR